ncbi:MAG TPA: hypothetical protein VMN79_06790 [Casimicrobiaceae bacterium]|nr:hypothetical protein [Casimicrobiaceae bacterium]
MTDFVFTMTTGRSGTRYLAELLQQNLPDAECYHEIVGWDRFGVDTPDVSHMTLFNSQGNVEKVREFWRAKLTRIASTRHRFYVETSHVLMKAGLVENIAPLTAKGRVHFVLLERDTYATIASLRRRLDFVNKGTWWLWYLDPDYPKNLVRSAELVDSGISGLCLWYVLEIRARAAYYRKLLKGTPNVVFHTFDLEELRAPEGIARFLAALGAPRDPAQISVPGPRNTGQTPVQITRQEEQRIRDLIASVESAPRASLDASIPAAR